MRRRSLENREQTNQHTDKHTHTEQKKGPISSYIHFIFVRSLLSFTTAVAPPEFCPSRVQKPPPPPPKAIFDQGLPFVCSFTLSLSPVWSCQAVWLGALSWATSGATTQNPAQIQPPNSGGLFVASPGRAY